jgi:multidrug efflux pump subunit AcrB
MVNLKEAWDNLYKKTEQSYLEKLKFDENLKKGWLSFFINNIRVVILIILFLFSFGIYAFLSLPRESSPEVEIPFALVSTIYPGASPLDIEELISKKIENSISAIEGINTITSNSSNSLSVITVEFLAGADLDDSIRKLRDEVSSMSSQLPSEASDPLVSEISFDDVPILTIALTGPYTSLELRKIGDDLGEELEKIKGIREVRVSGGKQTEIEVAYDLNKLLNFGLSFEQVNQIVRASNITVPAGNFSGEKYLYPIRVDNQFKSIDDLANTPLFHSPEGAIVYLKDLALVQETVKEKTVFSRFSVNGEEPEENITIQLIKKTGAPIIDSVDEAIKVLDTNLAQMPSGLNYQITDNSAERIADDFRQLTKDFGLTFLLVFLVLFLVIGIKEALVAGIAIPLTFFSTFIVMDIVGISLNFLSVFSLILALGLLVDDAIVVVSATKQYLRTGKFTPEEAVLLVLKDFKVVLLTTTLTTIWAFLPLLMATGIIGEFIKSIPITVSVTFIASFIIALIINHPLAAVLERFRFSRKFFSSLIILLLLFAFSSFALFDNLTISLFIFSLILLSLIFLIRWYFKGGKNILKNNSRLIILEKRDDELIRQRLKNKAECSRDTWWKCISSGIISLDKILPSYERYLRKIINSKKSRFIILFITTILFFSAVSLPVIGVIENEFFPDSDFDVIYINIEAPAGLKLEENSKIVSQVENRLLNYPEIKSFSTLVGSASSFTFGSGGSSSHLSSITLNLVDKKNRDITSYNLADIIRADLSNIMEADIRVEPLRGGPPVSSPFEARIKGDDLLLLEKISDDMKDILRSIEGTVDISSSLKESPAEYTFVLNPDRVELYNLNPFTVAQTLRLAISGIELTTILQDGKETEVIARIDSEKIPNLESIQNLSVLNNLGERVFLKDVANIELKPSVETITRINQTRTVTLTSNVEGGINPVIVVKEFQEKIKDYDFPGGYSLSFGGESEQNEESVQSILIAMILAGILIFSTLVIQFNSFKQAIIVLVTIPLALIGVFFGIAIVGVNLSFPGLIGILALFGIVVKNAIILIDKINLNIKSEIEFKESIVDAGKSRLEAILITSLCTILGILPITISDELWRALGSAVIFGLLLSSFLTLFIVPTLYMSIVKDKSKLLD